MKLHANARTCPKSRELICQPSACTESWSLSVGGRGRRRERAAPLASG